MSLDQAIRRLAIDPGRSFIVQAPAGSGKTELLIQRYLSLLTQVSSPEEILAITFTNKAANELRERINQALQLTQQVKPSGKYQALTWQLARKVAIQSQQLDWNLITNPARLRIQTIDSFCFYLVQCMPLLSGLGLVTDVGDHRAMHNLYTSVVENLVLHPVDIRTQNALECLLLHLDNHVVQLRQLLVQMLIKRDQWLGLLSQMKNQADLRQYLEHNLQILVQKNLQQAQTYFPQHLLAEAFDLLEYVIPANNPPGGLAHWQSLINLLLTHDNQWRRQLTKRDGFPAKSAGKDSAEQEYFGAQKHRALQLLAQLAPLEDLRAALTTVRLSPTPRYTEQQWRLIDALLHLLPVAAAELNLLFQQQHKVDFIEMTSAALRALGEADSPSDLALQLDYKIKHILVDEFQDTSAKQFMLLERLTAGWQANDGRTLFLVGDPMQSIYRFRGAEVGLFLRAQQQGIGDVRLEPLTLQMNFRAQAHIIDWINRVFPQVFPLHEAIDSNKVTFTPFFATKPALPTQVELYYQTEQHQASATKKIIGLIQQAQIDDPQGTIAVLVRSRRHLIELIPALQQHAIAYQAIKIENLAETMTIQDLISLSCALLHPGDRLAWLSLLRSPCCGLTLSDLRWIAQYQDSHTVVECLADEGIVKNLSVDGQRRVNYLSPLLQQALSQRQSISLRDWIEQTWLALRGPATLTSPQALNHAQDFFELLSQLEAAGSVINRSALSARLSSLYASAAPLVTREVQLMTVHQAKGLEFDTVIIPSLEKTTQQDSPSLLLWLEQPREDQGSDLFLAPINARYADHDPIYRYLSHQQQLLTDYETTRLLYVAVTRAKKRLYLVATIAIDEHGNLIKPAEKTWLASLWEACKTDFNPLAAAPSQPPLVSSHYLRRLSDDYFT